LGLDWEDVVGVDERVEERVKLPVAVALEEPIEEVIMVVLAYAWVMEVDEDVAEVMVEEASVVWVEEALVLEELLLLLLLLEELLEELLEVLEGAAVLLDLTVGETLESMEIRGV